MLFGVCGEGPDSEDSGGKESSHGVLSQFVIIILSLPLAVLLLGLG
jgi:hypothetical protein